MSRFLLLVTTLVLTTKALPQEKCGTMHLIDEKKQRELVQLEKWIENGVKLRQEKRSARIKETEVYRIPVVFHIIYKGEPYGEGSNIPDEQIFSQIDILNDDYRRLNEDTINTPEIYQNRAADSRIEFVLARQNPEGLPTTGINRIENAKNAWTISDFVSIANLSNWNSEHYLNIWVADLEGLFLGWAQFPTSSMEGLGPAPSSSLTDGVVIDYEYLGIGYNTDSFSRGRTATHEIGHYLGLRHTWGDDADCDIDDFVEDTPLSSSSSSGCPSNKSTCGSRDMWENYMDYTADACMNMFTHGQRDRMHFILENSPRRRSLINSPGLEEPAVFNTDLGIRRIISPQPGSCDTLINPVLEIRNYGIQTLEAFKIKLYIGSEQVQEIELNRELSPLETAIISFSQVAIINDGLNKFTFVLDSIGSFTDENTTNNIASVDVIQVPKSSIPLAETFDSLPANWSVINYDSGITWSTITYTEDGRQDQALFYNSWDYTTQNEYDQLVLPAINLDGYDSAYLQFKIAYAPYPGIWDGVKIAASTDCGNNFNFNRLIYEKSADELGTVPASTSEFIPTTRFDWRTETISLSSFIGVKELILSIIGVNGYGNNIFIDDLVVRGIVRNETDVEIVEMITEELITCETPKITTRIRNNNANASVDSVLLSVKVNEQEYYKDTLFEVTINPLDDYIHYLELDNKFSPGFHLIESRIEIVGSSEVETVLENNVRSSRLNISKKESIIPPERFVFESAINPWSVINENDLTSWVPSSKSSSGNHTGSLVLNYYNESSIGNRDQLISPPIALEGQEQLSLFFDISYAYNQNLIDSLKLIAWDGCNTQNKVVLFNDGGENMAVMESNSLWSPKDSTDWKRIYIDMEDVLSMDQPYISFEATGGYGNNIYLDAIEFFLSNNSNPVIPNPNEILIFPNPASGDNVSVAFNLFNKQDIDIKIIDATGKQFLSKQFSNTLNQTYPIPVHILRPGLYLMFIRTNEETIVKRFQRY